MDLSTGILLGVVALLALNRVIFLGERWFDHQARFWTIQVLNLLGASALSFWGIPAFADQLRVVSWLMAGLLVFHIVHNNRRLQAAVLDDRKQQSAAADARREALVQRLRPPEQPPELPPEP